MNATQQAEENKRILEGVVSRWCPASGESFDIRMVRALLHLNAYEQDLRRVMMGGSPIRTSYPLPLPTPNKELLEALEAVEEAFQSCVPDRVAVRRMVVNAIAKAKGEA